jgi:hypothetical protein
LCFIKGHKGIAMLLCGNIPLAGESFFVSSSDLKTQNKAETPVEDS